MVQWNTLALFLLCYLIWIAPQRSSAASLVQALRFLAQQADAKPFQQVSPSPSPDPEDNKSNNISSFGGNRDANHPAVTPETCEMVLNKCHYDLKNVTACVLPDAGYGTLELLVLNDGDSSVKLNVTILPTNYTYNDTEIPGHQERRINVSSNARRSSSIVLSALKWDCTIQIHTGVPLPSSFPSYAAYVTPINGAYVLFATAVLIGGMYACCRMGKNRRHLGEVPYQELEMGQQPSATSINVETADGWDQSWDDDDWDEEKAVKSPDGNGRANGVNPTPTDTNGWGNDWDD